MSLMRIRKKSAAPSLEVRLMARALRGHGGRDHINPRTAAKRFRQVNARRLNRNMPVLMLKTFVHNYNPALPYRKDN